MLDALAALIKALSYGALLTCVGAVFASATLRVPAELTTVAVRLTRNAVITLICASAAGLIVLVVRLGGHFDQATFGAVFSSSTGASLFIEITGAILLLMLGNDDSALGMRFASAALITLSLAFNGHAAVIGPFEGLFVFAHASAAAWWIGSLLLLRFTCKEMEISQTVNLLRRFSLLAARLIGGLMISGLLLIYALVGFDELPSLSAYERNLTIKLALVALVLALAAYNKFRLTARLLNGEAAAALSLRKMIDVELLLIAAVLAATSILTTYTSPHGTVD